MADSTHTLEIELRTKDFATASLKRVGDEGKKAAETISTSMDSAGSTIKSFGDRWLKLDGDFKMVAKAGAQAMNAVNVGIQTANMNSENMGRTLVSAGSSIAMGFATGGPVGGALAATAAAVGLIAGAFDDTEEAAQRARDEILKMQPEMNRLSTTFTESVKKIITLRGEQARSIEISERMQRTGETRAQATYEVDLARAAREVTKAYQDRRKALEEASKIMKAAGDLTNKEEYARIKAQEQAAMAAFEEAERAVKALADLRAGRATDLALLDKIAQKEQEAAQRRKEAEAEKGRAAQLAEENKQLAEQAKEMIRINKLSEEGKAIDGMRQMMIRLQAAGMKDLAAQLNTMIGMELMRLNTAKALNEQEQKRKQELEAARDAFENNIKDMGFFNDQAKQAKEHIKGIAKTDLASPIRQAAQELKRLTEQRAPGRGGAQFDEEGNFLGLGLAEARQERRDALRSMKRRRAERGRMGVGIGKSVNLRSGRRAGGLGAFSAWQGGGGDMGITQPGDEGTPSASPNVVVSLDQAPVSDVGIMRAATKSKMTGVPSLDLGIEGAKVTIASVLEKATKATEGLVEAAKEGAKSAETAKTNTDTAASETSRMADALEGMSTGMQELSTSMAQAAQAVTAMSTVVTKVVSDVERLKEAARLMGGN